MFADNEFYTSIYHGDLSGKELERNLRRANAYMSTLILRVPTVIPDEVKFAVCEIADIFGADEKHSGILSENNDGYSVTYDSNRSAELKAYDTAVLYLANTGLLNRGI